MSGPGGGGAGGSGVGSVGDAAPGSFGDGSFTPLVPKKKKKPVVSVAPKEEPVPAVTKTIDVPAAPPPVTTLGKPTASGIRTPAPPSGTPAAVALGLVDPDTDQKGRSSDVFAGTLGEDEDIIRKKKLGAA